MSPSVTLQSKGHFLSFQPVMSFFFYPLPLVRCTGVSAATCRCLCHSDVRGGHQKTKGEKMAFCFPAEIAPARHRHHLCE